MDEEKLPLLLCKKTYVNFRRDGMAVEDDGLEFLHVERPVYLQDELNRNIQYSKPSQHMIREVKRSAKGCCTKNTLKNTLPILRWLPEYNWKVDLIADVISGMTVAVMHIPQGLAYALLGNVPPITGIYMAFFPVLIYFFFGSSRHVSMGTFAVICLMTGKVVSQQVSETSPSVNATDRADDESLMDQSRVQVASTVTFTVAILQLIMYIFRLGIASTLLSDTLVAGFTCGSAFQVLGTQLKDFLGLPMRKRRGFFRFPLTVYDVAVYLPKANKAVLIISILCCTAMALNDYVLKPWLKKRTRVPFPIELVAVVSGTVASFFMNFQEIYNISVVGDIPTGLPVPSLPNFELIPTILVDCFLITVVSYTISMSMALIFAQKNHYEVDANQEFLAMGLSNFVGSFFRCMPITASLSRSMIQEGVGGVTQLASIVSCSILLFVLLWIGPCFEMLPKCVLASIIIMALRGMLMKARMIYKYYLLSKWDALVWIVTFTVTAFIDISIGLGCGVLISLFSLFVQGYTPYTCLMGVVPNTDLYLDIRRYRGVEQIPGIQIFHYSGGLNFSSKQSFRKTLYKRIGFDPSILLSERAKMKSPMDPSASEGIYTKCIVLDFSALNYIDPSGVQLLRQLQNDFHQLGIEIYIANCSGPVFETIKKCDKYEGKDSRFMVFPSIHDAVLYAKMHVLNIKSA